MPRSRCGCHVRAPLHLVMLKIAPTLGFSIRVYMGRPKVQKKFNPEIIVNPFKQIYKEGLR